MGTPDFAAAALQSVLSHGAARVVGVYTQPDRPCGRGQKCAPPPVKTLAQKHGLPVFQPTGFKDPQAVAQLAALAPDVLLVAAYGLILPSSVLDIPRLGPWNVHASLLPKYRGAAPIQRAIMAGESETGITIMRMEAGLDTGPMLLKRSVPIGEDETGGGLHGTLAALGGEMAVEALRMLAAGPVHPQEQDASRATYAAKLTKADTLIDWSLPAQEAHNRIRAMWPRPGASFLLELPGENRRIRLQAAPGRILQARPRETPPGRVVGLSDEAIIISCSDRLYGIPSIKPDGKKFMSAQAFACGYLHKFDAVLPLVCPPPDSLLDAAR